MIPPHGSMPNKHSEIVKERDDAMLSSHWILETVPKYVRIEPKMIINIKELTEI